MRRIPSRLPLALALGCALLTVLAARPCVAVQAHWHTLESAFRKAFKPGKTSLAKRRDAVQTIAQSADGRGVKLLLDATHQLVRYADKLEAAWQKAQDDWTGKTSRLERQREERMRKIVEKARKEGKTPPPYRVDLNSEEGRWLGAPPKVAGEMVKAREALMRRYDEVQAERALEKTALRAVAHILAELRGDELDHAVGDLLAAQGRAKGPERLALVATLGYVPGEAVTQALVKEAQAGDAALQQVALKALGRQNSEEGKKVLLGYLHDESWQVRSAALDGLIFYRDVGVVDALLAQAAEEEGSLRRRIFQTMSAIVGERVKAVLEAWQSWWPTNKQDVVASWKRVPRPVPVQDDPVRPPIETQGNDGSTSFYGIKTNSKHVIFVADISGSMARKDGDPAGTPAKIDVCREELEHAIRGLSAHDEDERGAATFNVVLFSTDVRVYKPGKMIVATKHNKDRAFKWIDENVKADMQTNIYDAIAQAFHIISASSDRKNRQRGADTMFLMTDGTPTRGTFIRPQVILREVRRLNQGRDITIHTIGVGKGQNAEFLRALAAQNGGQYLAR
jgi:hypothetical protein